MHKTTKMDSARCVYISVHMFVTIIIKEKEAINLGGSEVGHRRGNK